MVIDKLQILEETVSDLAPKADKFSSPEAHITALERQSSTSLATDLANLQSELQTVTHQLELGQQQLTRLESNVNMLTDNSSQLQVLDTRIQVLENQGDTLAELQTSVHDTVEKTKCFSARTA